MMEESLVLKSETWVCSYDSAAARWEASLGLSFLVCGNCLVSFPASDHGYLQKVNVSIKWNNVHEVSCMVPVHSKCPRGNNDEDGYVFISTVLSSL